jgi:hypothetical protein
MNKVDPRSLLIGFLLAVIGFLSMGAADEIGRFDTLEVNSIKISEGGDLIIGDYTNDHNIRLSKLGLVIENGVKESKTIVTTSVISIQDKDGFGVLGSSGFRKI